MWDWSLVSKIWLCLLIAAILGGIIGFLLRHLFCKKEHDVYEGRLREKEDEIARLRASVSNVKGVAVVENSIDDAEIAVWKKKVSALEADLNICHERQFTLEGELKNYSAKAVGFVTGGEDEDAVLLRTKLQASESEKLHWLSKKDNDSELEAKIVMLRNQLQAAESQKLHLIRKGGSSSDLDDELAELRIRLQEAESEKIYLLSRVKKAEAGETITIVPMNQRDDLELVNGIGPVLERMLYEMGIYFFKDIAAWDAAKIAEINEQLPGFQGRIEREGWVESAKEEHYKKYGEKL